MVILKNGIQKGTLYPLRIEFFAWMTYLNDLDSGNTDFKHFDLSIKPEKGKTLIWPAEWTHAHRGSLVKKENILLLVGFIFLLSLIIKKLK